MVVARSAGSFLGGILNNPGAVIALVALGAIFFFRNDIRKAFENISTFEFPAIELPKFPEFPSFPEIKFPEFPDFSAVFQSLADQISKGFAGLGTIGGTTVSPTMPPDVPTDIPPTTLPSGLGDVDIPPSVLDPSGIVTSETPPTFDASQFVTEAELQARLEARDAESEIAPVSTIPFAVVTRAEPTSQLNIGQEQPFTLAPLGAQTLSSIIDRFMVTASQAANIRFISQQGGDPFADPSNIFGENPPAVSDPQFQGLTPEQIALRLTGGNISNF